MTLGWWLYPTGKCPYFMSLLPTVSSSFVLVLYFKMCVLEVQFTFCSNCRATWPYEVLLLPKVHVLRLSDLNEEQQEGTSRKSRSERYFDLILTGKVYLSCLILTESLFLDRSCKNYESTVDKI